ncbi:putative G-protein coupled receptor 25 [Aulostomus maculatus]
MEPYTDYPPDYYYYTENSTNDEFTNFSIFVDCPTSLLQGSNVFLPILYFLMFFMGLFGNIFVISVVGCKGRKGGRLVDTFVVNLALADLIFILTLPLWAVSASRYGSWDFGVTLCKLSSYIISVNRFSNIFFLTCMSVDRYLAVVKLMASRNLRRSGCICATCAGVWMSSLILGIPFLVCRRVGQSTDGRLACQEDYSSPFFLGLSLTVTFLAFVVPVFIIMVCYSHIVLHLHKHCAAANPRAEARRRHSLKMVISIIVAFVVSWLPFNIFKVIIISSQLLQVDLSCDTLSWQRNGLLVSCCLAFLNSCVNPAIYVFLDNHFRQQAKILYKNCTKWPLMQQSHNSSASFANIGTLESLRTTGGKP